jgi:hypothetical protein
MINVSGKALGRKKPLFADFSIPFPPDLGGDRGDGALTLRDLITRVVVAEVDAFRKRQHDNSFLRALTARQIEEGAARGKIDSGGRDLPMQEVDTEEAVGTALQAFEDGLYLVVLDGQEQRDLDQEVRLTPDSRVTFVRLVMLAGG